MPNLKTKIFPLLLFLAAFLLSGAPAASSLELSHYTERSLLSGDRGLVVRIGVEGHGLYILTPSRLRSLGFAHPERVRVYGYGGRRIADTLTAENYVDDLPEVYSEWVEGRGLVFYALGAEDWNKADGEFKSVLMNPYSVRGHYFIAEAPDDEAAPSAERIGGPNPGSRPATTFIQREHHELELVSPGETSGTLVGEDFRNSSSRTFDFTLTDPAPDSEQEPGGWMECSFVARTTISGSSLSFTVNGTHLDYITTDRIVSCPQSQHYHGQEALTRHRFKLPEGKKLTIGVRLNSAGSITSANLNYLSVNYRRKLAMPSTGYLCFSLSGTGAILAGGRGETRVWDVTTPEAIKILDAAPASDGSLQWSTPYNGERDYAAWNPDAVIPEPVDFKTVSPQNLHGPRENYPQYIIIAPHAYNSAAKRLAALHEQEGMTVEIVDPEAVYNEFSSGTTDPSGIRKYLKMMLDRSRVANPEAPLQYVMLMTRPTYDARHLTIFMQENGYPTIPSWMPRTLQSSLSDTDGYTTDDFYAILEDGSGSRLGYDILSIAVGRVPVTSLSQANSVVDKFYDYQNKARAGLWKHRLLFTADDEDSGIHLQQTEDMVKGITDTPLNQHFIRKIYLDAYAREGKTYPAARADLFRYLEEGVAWWNFVGHANTTSWTGNGLLTFTDMNNMYLRHWPFLYTATCDFLRWDSNTTSGGELIFMERYGGGIGAISAIRPVYISDNGMLSSAMGRALALRDSRGNLPTPGEIYRRAKNDIRDSKGNRVDNSNRLRYVFMGDPALRLCIPDNIITIDKPDDGADLVAGAGGSYTLTGRVCHPVTGETLADFNGTLRAELFDAEESHLSNGWGEGKQLPFDTYGQLLASGAAEVKDGVFTLRLALPEVTSQNYRPAALSLYAETAATEASRTTACGLFRDLYVFGESTASEADSTPPSIDVLALNHSSFKNGSTVNASPVLIAEVTDDTGINVSTTGIGRGMVAILDGKKSYTNIVTGYSPFTDGRTGGQIVYTLSDLTDGAHTLALQVWDTAGNVAERSIDFFVNRQTAPVIYKVYTDANPATTQANFYITHDRPEAMATVTVTVYNLLGKPVWTGSANGPSDMFESVPVSWNLCDSAGRRVPRGIYVYRATIKSDGDTYETASMRLAVAAE